MRSLCWLLPQKGAGTGTHAVSTVLLSRSCHSAPPVTLVVLGRQLTLLWHCPQSTLSLHCLPPYEETEAERNKGGVCAEPGHIPGTTRLQVLEEIAAVSLSCDTHSHCPLLPSSESVLSHPQTAYKRSLINEPSTLSRPSVFTWDKYFI